MKPNVLTNPTAIWLMVVTTGVGVQGRTKAGAGLQKQSMLTCLENGTRKRAGVSALT